MKLEWKDLGGGAVLALCIERVMVAVVTGPHDDGYTVMIKSTGKATHYSNLISAKTAAERESSRREVSGASNRGLRTVGPILA